MSALKTKETAFCMKLMISP